MIHLETRRATWSEVGVTALSGPSASPCRGAVKELYLSE